MPSPSQTSIDLPINTFGGLVTQYDPQTLPPGASPFCQDVAFSGVNPAGGGIVGGWASRPGMGTGFYATPFAGNPTVNYVKTFTNSTGAIHTLSIDGLGVFRDESPSPIPPTVPSIIGQVIAASYIQSDALFNREFMAIGDGNEGLDIPRQWDGQYFDRISQVGPGAPPACADGAAGNVDAGLHQIAVAFITREQYITRPSPYVNYTAPGSKKINLTNIPIGPPNIIARVILATGVITAPAIGGDFYFFDGSVPTPSAGTFPSMVINDNTTTAYTIDFISAVLENTPIATNLYNMLELGECAQFTAYSDRIFAVGERNNLPNNINPTFDGGFTNGPVGNTIGPNANTAAADSGGPNRAWVIAGIGGTANLTTTSPNALSNFYNGTVYGLPGVPAGATIAGIVATVNVQANAPGVTDFTVRLLKAGVQVGADQSNGNNISNSSQIYGGPNNLWGTTWLPADIANIGIAYQVFNGASGGRQVIVSSIKITVYYYTAGAGSAPLGWTQGATFAGGQSALQAGLPAYWGDAYAIAGDGATANRGLITQSMFQDFLGYTILQPNTSYRVRVRLAQNSTLAAGVLHINLQSATGAFTTIGLAIPFSALTASYAEFQAFLTDVPLSAIPADIVMQVYADGTPTLNGVFLVDCIEVYPANFPVNRTLIRASYAEQPEAFDELTGLLSINAGDGQAVRLTFNILDNKLYIVKDRSMYSTQDDGQNEPDLWSISTVSNTVGTLSNRGVGIGESWAVIAGKQGAYIFWGSEPVKISQEIQPTWDQINWNFGYTMYVVVDTNNKRIHIGAPLGAATAPNVEFVCDYSQLANSEGATSAQDIASHPQAYYSVYQPTKLTAPGKARKWTIWNIKMNCAALTIRSDNSIHLLRGNGTGTGKIYDQLPTNLNDDGENAISVMYQTAYFPQTEDEQVLQLGAHRKTCTYMTGYAFGSGTLIPIMYGAQDQRGKALTQLPLVNPEQWDFEVNINFVAERMSILFAISGPTSWVQMTKLCPTIQRDIMTPVRGSK